MVRLKVRKVGNYLGVTLPGEAVRMLKVRAGDRLFLTAGPDGSFRITPYDPDFSDAMKAAESALRELAK